MKKIVSILVVLAMMLAMVPAAVAAETTGTINAVKGKNYTTETWTATEAGVLTITVSSAEGVGYKLYLNGETHFLSHELTYWDEILVEVSEGDECYLEVKGWNPDSWTFCDATITYSYSFNSGATVKEPYAISEQVITYANDNNLSIDGSYEIAMIDSANVTIVTVTPGETGVYTISVDDGALIGNYGGGSWFIYDSANVEHGTTLEWTCTTAGHWETANILDENGNPTTVEQYVSGQSLMLGIVSESEAVTVNVEKTGEYVVKETLQMTYENKAELTAFALPEDAVLGDYVMVGPDDATHTAVLGSDGYYHLDSADGDILLVDMDYMFRLSSALEQGRGVMYVYAVDAEGNDIRYDIGDAVKAYEAVCDKNGYYPLTEDLIFFYKDYASGSGVYDYIMQDGYNADSAWMYACLTMALPEAEEELQGDGTEENPYIITSLPYDIVQSYANSMQAMNGVYYQYTAEKDGEIGIVDVYEDHNTGVLAIVTDTEDWINLNEANYSIKKGETVLMNHYAFTTNGGDFDLTLDYVAASGGNEGGEEGGETPETPESDPWSGTNVAVAADEEIEIVFAPESDGVLEIEIDCATGWQIIVSDEFNEEAVWSDSDDISLSFNLTAGTAYTVLIIPYDEANEIGTCDAVMSYELTFTPAGESGGEEDDENVLTGELVLGDNFLELLIDSDASSAYTFTATETGTLYMVVTEFGCDYGSGEYSDNMDYLYELDMYTLFRFDGNALEFGYYGSFDVVAGETYTLTWAHGNWDDYGWSVNLNVSYSDEAMPKQGTEETPVVLYAEDCPTDSIEIAAGERAYYELVGFSGMNFTITGTGAYAVIETIEWDQVTGDSKVVETVYRAKNGVVTVYIENYFCQMQIGNNGSSAAVFELDASYPLGAMENPASLKMGANKVSLAEDNYGYYLTWTATKDGVLSVAVSGDYWMYRVVNYGADMYDDLNDNGGEWHTYGDEVVVASEDWTVKAGDIIMIMVSSYDPETGAAPATEITVTASFKADGAEDVLRGDVNGDGKINARDAMLALRYVAGEVDDSAVDLDALDANGDGKYNARDAMLILRYVAGEITEFPL